MREPTFELRVDLLRPGMLKPGGTSPSTSQDLTALGDPVTANTRLNVSPTLAVVGEEGLDVNVVAPESAFMEEDAAKVAVANCMIRDTGVLSARSSKLAIRTIGERCSMTAIVMSSNWYLKYRYCIATI